MSSDLTNPLKKWVIYTSSGIDASTNFSDLVLKPENGLIFKFLQDLDNDGIDAAQEFILGSSDSNTLITVTTPDNLTPHEQMAGFDSDLDGLPDSFEFFGGPTPGEAPIPAGTSTLSARRLIELSRVQRGTIPTSMGFGLRRI